MMKADHRTADQMAAYELHVEDCRTHGHRLRRDGTCSWCFKLVGHDPVMRERVTD